MKNDVQSNPGRFTSGHERLGGRKRGSITKRTAEAREVAAKLGFHPIEFLAIVAMRGVIPNADGTETPVDAAMRLDAAKAAAPYLVPKLAQTAVVGPNEGPVELVGFDLTPLLKDPVRAAALTDLAYAVCEAGASPEPLLLEAHPDYER